jgi:PAS domain-containing protein
MEFGKRGAAAAEEEDERPGKRARGAVLSKEERAARKRDIEVQRRKRLAEHFESLRALVRCSLKDKGSILAHAVQRCKELRARMDELARAGAALPPGLVLPGPSAVASAGGGHESGRRARGAAAAAAATASAGPAAGVGASRGAPALAAAASTATALAASASPVGRQYLPSKSSVGSLLRDVFHDSAMPMFLCTEDLRVLDCNEAFSRLVNAPRDVVRVGALTMMLRPLAAERNALDASPAGPGGADESVSIASAVSDLMVLSEVSEAGPAAAAAGLSAGGAGGRVDFGSKKHIVLPLQKYEAGGRAVAAQITLWRTGPYVEGIVDVIPS